MNRKTIKRSVSHTKNDETVKKHAYSSFTDKHAASLKLAESLVLAASFQFAASLVLAPPPPPPWKGLICREKRERERDTRHALITE